MADVLRVVLLVALAAALLTTLSLALSWWMEPARRLRRALLKALGAAPEVEALSPGDTGRRIAAGFAQAADADAGFIGHTTLGTGAPATPPGSPGVPYDRSLMNSDGLPPNRPAVSPLEERRSILDLFRN